MFLSSNLSSLISIKTFSIIIFFSCFLIFLTKYLSFPQIFIIAVEFFGKIFVGFSKSAESLDELEQGHECFFNSLLIY
jgi:hypothetical protein